MPTSRAAVVGIVAAFALLTLRRWWWRLRSAPTEKKTDSCAANSAHTRRPIVFIWSHPRALSTALLRSLAELPGATTVLEPFMVPWQLDLGVYRGASASPPNYEQAIAALKAVVATAPTANTATATAITIVKDMPCHGGLVLLDRVTAAFPHAQHVLLVRHPFRAVPSFMKVSVGYSDEVMRADISYAGLVEYAERLAHLWQQRRRLQQQHQQQHLENHGAGGGGGGGSAVVVPVPSPPFLLVDADDFVRDPEPSLQRLCAFVGADYTPELLAWEANAAPPSWGNLADFEDWLDAVLGSSGWVRKPDLAAVPAEPAPKDGLPLQAELIAENMPLYARLQEVTAGS